MIGPLDDLEGFLFIDAHPGRDAAGAEAVRAGNQYPYRIESLAKDHLRCMPDDDAFALVRGLPDDVLDELAVVA